MGLKGAERPVDSAPPPVLRQPDRDAAWAAPAKLINEGATADTMNSPSAMVPSFT
jgi:hypothetical protein